MSFMVDFSSLKAHVHRVGEDRDEGGETGMGEREMGERHQKGRNHRSLRSNPRLIVFCYACMSLASSLFFEL